MHKYLQKTIVKFLMLSQILFLSTLFFSGCTTKKIEVDPDDREKIHSFLNQLLFVNSSVYTLFGEKPISDMVIFIGAEDEIVKLTDADMIELTEEERKNMHPWDESLIDNWKIWKRYVDKIDSKNFIFNERLSIFSQSHLIYSIFNIKLVKEILCKYRKEFEKQTGGPFDSDKVISEYKDPESPFWEKIYTDHYLSGLLYGFGEENITYFLNKIETQERRSDCSEEDNPFATIDNLPIPIFAMSPQDKTCNKYREQRTKIQSIYQNKDIVDVTLKRLME